MKLAYSGLGYIVFRENREAAFEIEVGNQLLKECLSAAEIPEIICLYYYKGN
ncbi:hypothetical protein LI951_10325 [Enterococcus sp. BWT-B8]|uniref:hypothetical protein n=1 Tax=Enterococcus sp. BWT-B8 TaxID=2885157 RepID=UPI001E354B56|nr:hypothetical protein [Enterococcus sp. BWT-B8]MCB5952460.1 hypothetical protein [Enterococcus sp. BWT-B8]